jgi:hypothetical protein
VMLIILSLTTAELQTRSSKSKTNAWLLERKASREKFSRMDQ